MTAPARPDAETLRKYNRGLLSPEEVVAVEAWMAENSQAADLLDEAAGRDSVIDALNDTGASGETPAGTNVQQVRPKVEMALPTKVREFEITGLIGQGGMGAVYAARDTILNRSVAVKLIAAEFAAHAGARERFLREAQAVARIDHPNVVPVHSSGEDQGQLFLVMPLLRGETLAARLERAKRLPADEVARIGREVAAGLAAAHAVGLVHRDIKPGNIWLEADTGRVRILDFGLAKPLTDTSGGLTDTGVIVGTPFYMAPEQAEGQLVDGRTDLFSLGAVLYHAATGHRPFKGDTALAVLVSVKADTPPSADSLVTDLPPHLSSVIHKLLQKAPTARPSSAKEVIESLSSVAAVAVPSPFASLGDTEAIVSTRKPAPQPKKPTRWKRAAVAIGVLAVLIATAVAIGLLSNKPVENAGNGDEPKMPLPTPPGNVQRPPSVLPLGTSPFDRFDPKTISAAERYPGEPEELVAMLGTSAQSGGYPTFYTPPGTNEECVLYAAGNRGWELWNPKTGERKRLIPSGNAPQRTLISADGTRMILDTTASRGQFSVCDITGAEPRKTADVPRIAEMWSGTVALSQSTDRKTFCICAADRKDLWVHDWSDRDKPVERAKITIREADTQTGRTALSADGKLLAVGLRGKRSGIDVYDLSGKEPKLRCQIEHPQNGLDLRVAGFDFTANGNLVLNRGKIGLWDVSGEKARLVAETAQPTEGAYLSCSPDGRYAVVIVGHHHAHVFRLTPADGVLPPPILGESDHSHQNNVEWHSWSRDGSRFVTQHMNGGFTLFDIKGDKIVATRRPMTYIDFGLSADGSVLLAKRADYKLEAFAVKDGAFRAMPGKDASAFDGYWTLSKNAGLIAGRDTVWYRPLDPNGKKHLYPLAGGCNLYPVGADGKLVVLQTNTANGTENSLWDFSGDKPKRLTENTPGVAAEIFDQISADETTLVSRYQAEPGPLRHHARLWRVANGKMIPGEEAKHETPILGTLSPDGKLFASCVYGNLWEVSDGKFTRKIGSYYGNGVGGHPAFSPDGKWVAFCGGHGSGVEVVDWATKERIYSWRPSHAITKVEFAPDGRHLLMLNGDGTILVVRLAAPSK